MFAHAYFGIACGNLSKKCVTGIGPTLFFGFAFHMFIFLIYGIFPTKRLWHVKFSDIVVVHI